MLGFLKTILLFFNKTSIEYMLSGSVALSTYVLPRATRDFDFIVHLKKENVDAFVEYFSEKYYCDKDAVLDAVHNKSMFNIIDSNSGFKADFVILNNEKFRQTEFARRKQINLFDLPVYVVSAEDCYYQKSSGYRIFKAISKWMILKIFLRLIPLAGFISTTGSRN